MVESTAAGYINRVNNAFPFSKTYVQAVTEISVYTLEGKVSVILACH